MSLLRKTTIKNSFYKLAFISAIASLSFLIKKMDESKGNLSTQEITTPLSMR